MQPLHWFDGHLDLAYLAQQGRDMLRPASEVTGPQAPAAVTFPSLREGNITHALATIFIQKEITEAEAKRKNVHPELGPWCYNSLEDAARAAHDQLTIYQNWHNTGIIHLTHLPPIPNTQFPIPNSPPLRVTLLLEGAAGVQSPEHFQKFYDAGVRVVSLTWNEGSQYSGGDQTLTDVTPLGKKLLTELDRLHIIHDVSHLSEKAFWTVLNETSSTKVASHSNCRALLPGKEHPERHLSDAQIKALAKSRDSIIGIVLFSKFIVSGPNSPPRAAIADILRHITHIEQLTGRRDLLALGSDMDGGFTADELPSDLTTPAHLPRFAEALSAANWTDTQIHHFAHQNWSNTLSKISVP